MRVSRGKTSAMIDAAELAETLRDYPLVAIDVGAGKGHFLYRLARRNPYLFCIGIEPLAANVEKNAIRSLRKPSRGGLDNLLYVIGSAEDPPPELAGSADQLFVLFPWGSLLRGLLESEDAVLGGLISLCKPWARVEIVINRSLFQPPVSKEVEDLPEPSPSFIREKLAVEYAKMGLVAVESRPLLLDSSSTDWPATLWARRLSGRGVAASHIRLRRRGGPV